jgi:hypothetical protein
MNKRRNKMNEKLMRAVKRQLGSDYRDQFEDIYNHGVDGGFSGFIYYSDTVAFFKRNKAEIVELVKEYASQFDQSPIEFVKSFRCLEGDDDMEEEIAQALYGKLDEDNYTVPNALAWFAAEQAAQEYMENSLQEQ